MNKLTRPITIIAFFSVLLPIIFTFVTAAENRYDYSRPISNSNVTVNSADLLESYLGESISNAEYDYLSKFGTVTLSYSDTITSDRVICEYSSGSLAFKAYTYSYTAASGTELVWVPVTVAVGSEVKPLAKIGEYYFAEFASVAEDEGLTADVEYTLKITVSSEDITSIAQEAFLNAPTLRTEVSNRLSEYDRLYNEYLSDKADYEGYLAALAQYELDFIKYAEYLSLKALYDDALADYNAYLAELEEYNNALIKQEEYNAALESYNTAYSEYLVYLSELSDYNAKAEIYNKYLGDLEKAKDHLSIVDTAKVKMTLNRDVYSAVMGSLVTEVLVANKDALIAVGAKKEVIDTADAATRSLRILLPQYFSLKTEEEKYSYYSLNFEAFRDSFTKLTQSLDELYRNRKIRGAILDQGRGEKYRILVCQLAIISNALNSGPIDSYYGEYKFDSSYKIERQTINEVLGESYIKSGINPEPLASGYPREVQKPVAPELKEEPKAPTPVKLPARPESVDNPGTPPDEVKKPIKPSEVAEPTEPTPYVPDPVIVALIDAYNDGELAERTAATKDFEFTASTVLKKKIFGVTEVTVIFYGTDGNEVERCTVDKDTPVVYTGNIPVKGEDASATYTFAGWQDRDGNLYDLSAVPKDLELYPAFSAHTKYYDVTFDIDGVKTVISYPYGAMPSYEGTPQKADNGGIAYTFQSWDKEFSVVCENITYTAEFDSSYIVPFGNSGAEISLEEGFYIADCVSSTDTEIDIEGLLRRACASNLGIVLKTRFADVTISYSTVISMHGAGDSVISLSVVQKGVYGYSYRVDVKNKNGVLSESGYKISASVPCKLYDTPNNSLFFLNSDGERVYLNYTLADGRLNFKPTSGIEYTLIAEYGINIIASQYAQIISSHTIAHNGDKIELNLAVNDGYRIVRLRVLSAAGTEIPLIGRVFTMPSSDVTVVAECEPVMYTVTFMDGNKTIAAYTYGYGEAVEPPKAPVKASDARHKYTFIGWSDEIKPVTENVTYYAVYKTTLLPIPEESRGLQISPSVMRLLVAGCVAVFMLIAVVLPSVILLLIFFFTERKGLVKKRK